ncbi:MAG: DUF3108 domain-containing protein [Acidobacteria bacterium]|nr:MAG: DUF3108 domain-containing protein [Acidobacteriota bacterium]REK02874.1 MAG: DUF3108 domain-containing protein [Acidobacteriota bacterium]REK13322.1 MAG: DUF3108 domain-containing protein [Acidobacteriota bacterium]REK41316.1 MAG: DUF3108 domain-containing protein [Acidobacteriota bacterium]
MNFRSATSALFLIALSWTFVSAQSGAGPMSTPAADARTFSNPYSAGEKLEFEGKYKKFGFAFSIAEMTFSVHERDEDGSYYILSEAHSKGTLAKLFNFSFYQKIESFVDTDSLRVTRSVKRDEQRDRIRDSEATFDYQRSRVTWVETDPNDPAKPPKRVASTITEETHDLVTGVFALRGKKFAVGKTLTMKVSDSGLVYDVPVKIAGLERQKSIFGKVACWKIEPEIFGDGRVIEQKGSLTIWVTADKRRIPVRARLNTELGRVDIKLEKYTAPGETTPIS